MGEMSFYFSDLYPGLSKTETSLEAAPEKDDQDALNEDTKVSEVADISYARGSKIFLSVLVVVAIIIFLGGAN